MKTTEVFVEQVIIGFIVLGVIVLLAPADLLDIWPPGRNTADGPGQTSFLQQIGIGGVLVGVAYLLGIVYDRVADTLFQHWEQHGRLKVALADQKADALPIKGDLFPEDRVRHFVLKCSGLADHAGYLRTRLRLTRALATLMPAVGVAAMSNLPHSRSAATAAWGLLVIYGAVFGYNLSLTGVLSKQGRLPPKTRVSDRRSLQKYWETWRKPKEAPCYQADVPYGWNGPDFSFRLKLSRWQLFCDPIHAGLLFTMILGIWIAPAHWYLSLAFTALALVVAHTWWRIYGTYCGFLKTTFDVEPEFKEARAAWNPDAGNPPP